MRHRTMCPTEVLPCPTFLNNIVLYSLRTRKEVFQPIVSGPQDIQWIWLIRVCYEELTKALNQCCAWRRPNKDLQAGIDVIALPCPWSRSFSLMNYCRNEITYHLFLRLLCASRTERAGLRLLVLSKLGDQVSNSIIVVRETYAFAFDLIRYLIRISSRLLGIECSMVWDIDISMTYRA